MKPYEVLPGDTLWEIAIKHGFRSHTELLDVPENKALFENSERDENRIFPGDVIYFPQKTVATFEAKANGKRVFRTPSKKGFIRLEVLDDLGNPLEYFRYEAEMFGQTFSGDQSTFDGHIEIEVPQKKNGNKVLMPGEKSEEDKARKLTGNDKLKSETAEVKLYTNKDDSDFYELYRVHISYEPRDEKEGALKQLANHGVNNGLIPGVPYESELGRINNHCYAEDDWVQQQIEPMEGDKVNTELTPIPSAINFQPQYYPVVWEMLRYERLYKLSDQSFRHFESEVDALKSSREPYDASYALMVQAEMDLEYYQYCFNYWFSEFSSLWNAHVQKDSAADSLLRFRSHVYVDKKLTEITQKWRSEFEGENVSDEILHKPFPTKDIEHVPQLRDLFTTYYNTQQAKDKLATKIVSPPLTSRVRFSYQDDPEKPIANSFVLYWRYDKADDTKIETGREEFYNHARIMMPIGIGKTDSQGYLVQSMPFTGDDKKGFINTSDGHFTMHAGLESNEGLSHDHLQPFMARFESVADAQRFINDIKPLEGQWNDMFNQVNRRGGQKIYRRALFHIRNNFNAIQDSETYDEQVNKLLEYADSFENRYEIMRTSIANAYFNYYSSGSTDTWGFMVYPPDAGLMRTADLAKLGNEGKYAYKGPIRSPKDQHEFIQLPCTLQEWERRLKVENNRLEDAIKRFQNNSSSHQSNINSLGRMNSLLDLYKQYPYEYEEDNAASQPMRDELSAQVNDLAEAIQRVLSDPDEEKDKGLHTALKDMTAAKDQIMTLLQSEGFREQFALYQEAYLNDESESSPYMECDQTWQSVYGVIADSLAFLSMTPDADEVFEILLKPVLDSLITSKLVSELISDGLSEMISEMTIDESHGREDRIQVNKEAGVVTEKAIQLKEAVKDIYIDVNAVPIGKTLLNEIFTNSLYLTASWSKNQLNQWVNDMPGAPSILMVILESYSSFLVREAMANGMTKGYHIRLMMVIMHGFGFFSDDAQLKESDILKILRSNQAVRNAAKVNILEADLKLANSAVKKRQETLSKLEDKINAASPGEKVMLNGVKHRLEGRLKSETDLVFDIQDEIEDKIEKQIAREKQEVERYKIRRRENHAKNVDEFYDQADGRRARIYKSVIWGITVVGLVEDWAKVTRMNDDPSMPKVDADIVFAHYAKTVTDSAVACSSAVVLMNRWVKSENEIFKGGQFFLDNGDTFAKHADRLAVVGSVIALYISSRELYETYNNKTLLEKTDQYLDIAANAITTVGYLLARGTLDKLLCPLISAYLIPGLGQVLLIAGVLIMLVQMGIGFYVMWQGYRFKRDAPVGYYFWEEFESVREKGQRYVSDDDQIMACKAEVEAYDALMDVYENDDLLGKNNSGKGWGHLSWRGAVPFFVSWRRMGMPESQLLRIVENISKVPNFEFNSTDTSRPLTKETSIDRLLSPEAIVKFYLHMEETLNINPTKNIYFTTGDKKLTYRAVMNQLEMGAYIPKGETDDVIDHLNGIDDIKTLPSSGLTVYQKRYRNIVWNHEHFRGGK